MRTDEEMDEIIKQWRELEKDYESKRAAWKSTKNVLTKAWVADPERAKRAEEVWHDRITATEVVKKQIEAEIRQRRTQEEIQRMAYEEVVAKRYEEVVAKRLAEIAASNEASKIISDTLTANPQYNDRTKEIVKTLCKLYPKLDSVTLPGKELLIPFIFSIAYDIQKTLEDVMPEELK